VGWNSDGNCRHRDRWGAFDQLSRPVRDALNAATFCWCPVCFQDAYQEYLCQSGCPETAAALVVQEIQRADAAAISRREHEEQRRERRQRQARR
jgi:hypothetical protein